MFQPQLLPSKRNFVTGGGVDLRREVAEIYLELSPTASLHNAAPPRVEH
jgi:hypothetical protein